MVLLNKLLKLYYFFTELYNGNCVFGGTWDTILKLCRVYRGSESTCLTYCNFLKYDKNVIKGCLLPYSNHLRRHWEPGIIRLFGKARKSYRIIELVQRPLSYFIVKTTVPMTITGGRLECFVTCLFPKYLFWS